MEEKTGLSDLEKNAKGREQEKITFDDMVRQPRFIISSVTSTGKNDKNRRYPHSQHLQKIKYHSVP